MSLVLIPAFQPGDALPALVGELDAAGLRVLVVDDGSGPAFTAVFAAAERAGAVVVTHEQNRGKGAALRTGFAWARVHAPNEDVVTADADGQHAAHDIIRVAGRTAAAAARGDAAIVLGVRDFSGSGAADGVPPRSRIGNRATSLAFRLATGRRIRDTQTGLRGFAASTLPWLLGIAGDRFDYEFRVLLTAPRTGIDLIEVPIATIYLHANASSHFRPVRDSLGVWGPFVRFIVSALFAFALDTAAMLVLQALTGSLLLAVLGARVLSGSANYAINRALVFRHGRELSVRTSAWRYLSLASLLLAANFGMLTALTDAGVPLLWAKLATEGALFAASFSVQRTIVFAPTREMGACGRIPEASGACAPTPRTAAAGSGRIHHVSLSNHDVHANSADAPAAPR